jgi:hypothetical protein
LTGYCSCITTAIAISEFLSLTNVLACKECKLGNQRTCCTNQAGQQVTPIASMINEAGYVPYPRGIYVQSYTCLFWWQEFSQH